MHIIFPIIKKGNIEIMITVEFIKKCDKVGLVEAILIAKLRIRPFSYGLNFLAIYDNGLAVKCEFLNITEDNLSEKFAANVSLIEKDEPKGKEQEEEFGFVDGDSLFCCKKYVVDVTYEYLKYSFYPHVLLIFLYLYEINKCHSVLFSQFYD